jgi:predicted nucleic acid-binding protein
MIIVSNTSPITNLAAIGLLPLLEKLYGVVHIADGVWKELHAENQLWPGASEVDQADWIHRHSIQNTFFAQALQADLDPGEAETLALMIELGADLGIIDEQPARRYAKRLNLPVVGTIGLLIEAKSKGLIAAVRPQLDRLRTEAGFYIKADLYKTILENVGEQ